MYKAENIESDEDVRKFAIAAEKVSENEAIQITALYKFYL